jgi:hypothetical protein
MVLAEDVRESRDGHRREEGDDDPSGRPLDEMAVVAVPLQGDAVGQARRSGHSGVMPASKATQTTAVAIQACKRRFRGRLTWNNGTRPKGEREMIWLIVLLLVLFALVGGWAVSKLLLILLLVALALAVFGAFGRTA